MELIQTIRDTPFFQQKVTLEGVEYIFLFRWNQRDGWYLGLQDANRDFIFSPRKLVTGWDLLRAVRWNTSAPQGALLALDGDSSGVKPGFLELATSEGDGRISLVYVTEAERIAAGV